MNALFLLHVLSYMIVAIAGVAFGVYMGMYYTK